MANSHKKYGCVSDYRKTGTPYYKRQANKSIRKVDVNEIIADGKSYRKYYNSWMIFDYKFSYYSSMWGWTDTTTEECKRAYFNK